MKNNRNPLPGELRRHKKALTELTNRVGEFLALLDVEMKKPSNADRGRRIAQLSNALDMANDSVLHFTFGQSFQSIGNRKAKMARLAGLASAVHKGMDGA